jgi:two-component sensor histidine kinase
LSAPDGRISIEGKIDQLNGQSLFSFLWKERGGPLVSAPTRKGFGSVVLLDAAKHFGQRVAVDYAPQGLSYELELLLSTIIASKNLAKQESSTALNEDRAGSV